MTVQLIRFPSRRLLAWPSGWPGRGSYRLGDRGRLRLRFPASHRRARPCSRDGGRRHARRSDRRTRAVAGAGELPRRHGDRQRSASPCRSSSARHRRVGRRARRGRGAGARHARDRRDGAGRRIRHVPRPRPRRRDAGGRLGRSLRTRLRDGDCHPAPHRRGRRSRVGAACARRRARRSPARRRRRRGPRPRSPRRDTLFVIPGRREGESPEPTTW